MQLSGILAQEFRVPVISTDSDKASVDLAHKRTSGFLLTSVVSTFSTRCPHMALGLADREPFNDYAQT